MGEVFLSVIVIIGLHIAGGLLLCAYFFLIKPLQILLELSLIVWIRMIVKNGQNMPARGNCNLSSGFGAPSPVRLLLTTWIIQNTFAFLDHPKQEAGRSSSGEVYS